MTTTEEEVKRAIAEAEKAEAARKSDAESTGSTPPEGKLTAEELRELGLLDLRDPVTPKEAAKLFDSKSPTQAERLLAHRKQLEEREAMLAKFKGKGTLKIGDEEIDLEMAERIRQHNAGRGVGNTEKKQLRWLRDYLRRAGAE